MVSISLTPKLSIAKNTSATSDFVHLSIHILMRTLLFLHTETTGLDPEKDRIVQLGTRLVTHNQTQDFRLQIGPADYSISAAVSKINRTTVQVAKAQEVGIERTLAQLAEQIHQAEIIIGHNIDNALAIILTEARRTGRQDLIELLTHPRFGFDLGERAAICTRQLSADYLQFIGKPVTTSATKLSTFYRRLFNEGLPNAHDTLASTVACQRIYDYLTAFQLEKGIAFEAGILCLDSSIKG